MKKQMFYGAIPFVFERARELRLNTSPAEQAMWAYLRTKPLGVKFRRQHPLGPFIPDFYAHSIKLVIEIDGAVHAEHEQAIKDKLRQEGIESEGIFVLRFTNDTVMFELPTVKEKIESIIQERQSNKSNESKT